MTQVFEKQFFRKAITLQSYYIVNKMAVDTLPTQGIGDQQS